MNKEDIIRMAREAGYFLYDLTETHGKKTVETDTDDEWVVLERFAALVAEVATEAANARANTSWSLMCKKMVAAENEACAKLVDHILKEGGGTYGDVIRARGQA